MTTSSIAERRAFLQQTQTDLRLLQADVRLARRGYRFHYIVDFAAIFAYAYKTFRPDFLPRPWPESDERVFAKVQTALSLVFNSKQRQLLLIPPYALEIRNHLDLVAMRARIASLDARETYKAKFRDLVQRSPSFRRLMQVRQVRGPNIVEDATLRQAVIELGKELFPELFLIATWIAADGMATLRALLELRVLKDSGEVLSDLAGFDFSAVADNVDVLYNRILAARGRSDRAFQSFVDAMACAYVQWANARCNPNGEVVVLITPSIHVASVLAKEPLIDDGSGLKVVAVRSLNYFLMELVNDRDDLRIDRALAIIRDLLDVYSVVDQVESSTIELTNSLMAKAEGIWTTVENLFLLREGLPVGMMPLRSVEDARDAEFLNLIERMYAAGMLESEAIGRQIDTLLAVLHNKALELDKWLPTRRATEALEQISIRKLRGVSYMLLPGLPGEMPMTLRFQDPSTVLLADRLKDAFAAGDARALLRFRRSVLEMAEAPNSAAELCLLAGYLLAAEAKWEVALSELSRGLGKAGGVTKSEIVLLASVIHRKLYHPEDAIQLLERLLADDPKDPYANVEYANALWMRWRQTKDPATLESALMHLGVASNQGQRTARDTKPFRAQVENLWAFLLTERALNGMPGALRDLAEAEVRINRIITTLLKDKWIGRLHDTYGWFLYAKARIKEENLEEQLRLLGKARRRVNRALGLESSILERRIVLLEHLDNILEFERALKSRVGANSSC